MSVNGVIHIAMIAFAVHKEMNAVGGGAFEQCVEVRG